MLLKNPKKGDTKGACQSDTIPIDQLLAETFYCDHSHPAITDQVKKNASDSDKPLKIPSNSGDLT